VPDERALPGRLIKQAWEITWKHKYLWFFGFFAFGGSGNCGGGGNFNTPGNTSGFNAPSDLEIALLIFLGLVFLALVLVAIYLSWRCTGGLIDRVRHIASGKTSNFRETWEAGRPFFGRIFRYWGLMVLFVLAWLLLLGLCAGIGALLYFFVHEIAGIVVGVVLGLIVLLAMIAAMVLLTPITLWGLRYMVLENMPVIEGLKAGWGLTKRKLGPTVLNILVMIGFGLGFGLATLIVVCPFSLGAIGIMAATESTLGMLLFLPALALLFPLIAVFKTYTFSYYTLAFMELRNIEHSEGQILPGPVPPPAPAPIG